MNINNIGELMEMVDAEGEAVLNVAINEAKSRQLFLRDLIFDSSGESSRTCRSQYNALVVAGAFYGDESTRPHPALSTWERSSGVCTDHVPRSVPRDQPDAAADDASEVGEEDQVSDAAGRAGDDGDAGVLVRAGDSVRIDDVRTGVLVEFELGPRGHIA